MLATEPMNRVQPMGVQPPFQPLAQQPAHALADDLEAELDCEGNDDDDDDDLWDDATLASIDAAVSARNHSDAEKEPTHSPPMDMHLTQRMQPATAQPQFSNPSGGSFTHVGVISCRTECRYALHAMHDLYEGA